MSQMGQANFNLALEGLQGNVGGPVYSDALGMINIIGGAGFLVTGVPATSTLTITGPGFISQVDADAGNALPVAGIIALAGGLNIATAAAGNMVTINVDGTTDHCVQLGNAGGSLTSMAAGVNGQTIMGVTALIQPGQIAHNLVDQLQRSMILQVLPEMWCLLAVILFLEMQQILPLAQILFSRRFV